MLETLHKRKLEPGPGFRPALLADWDDATFVHYAVPPEELQPHVPFELDLFGGEAFVSLVAFTQRHLRPRIGGRIAAALSTPLASHPFLNVRTYVRHLGEHGIHFLCEWIPNRLAIWLGPPLYGLPYRLGTLKYRYDRMNGTCHHDVKARGACLSFDAIPISCAPPATVVAGTLDAFLLERYVAFTRCQVKDACFRVEHAPWLQRRANVCMRATDLLEQTGVRWAYSQPVCGHYSEGAKNVGLGPPVRLCGATKLLVPSPSGRGLG
jgi:hypothetical protein